MKIWVLGSNHRSADQCFEWGKESPYFPNSDVLIINTNTIPQSLYKTESPKILEKRDRIFDMLMLTKKKIFVIMGGPLDWLPVFPILRKYEGAEIGTYKVEKLLETYVKSVKKGDWHITRFNSQNFYNRALNAPTTTFPFAKQIARLGLIRKNVIRNQGEHQIGCSITVALYESTFLPHNDYREIYRSGEITFLPLPSEITPEEGIELLLNELQGTELLEIEPDWANSIIIPTQDIIESEISELLEEMQNKQRRIDELEQTKEDLTSYRRLLWLKGHALENIVLDAFKFLDFSEIRQERSEDLEDGIIDFNSSTSYEHGILEVKGADKRTALAHLTQCNKWVEDYLLDGKQVKGIFIPNQYRRNEYPASHEDREHFEPNELEYARTREICILPAQELFVAVIEKMKGNPDITREKIEEKILRTNGLCKLT